MRVSPNQILDQLDKMMDKIAEEEKKCPCNNDPECMEGCNELDGIFVICQVLEEFLEQDDVSGLDKEKSVDPSEIARVIREIRDDFIHQTLIQITVPDEVIDICLIIMTKESIASLYDSIIHDLESFLQANRTQIHHSIPSIFDSKHS